VYGPVTLPGYLGQKRARGVVLESLVQCKRVAFPPGRQEYREQWLVSMLAQRPCRVPPSFVLVVEVESGWESRFVTVVAISWRSGRYDVVVRGRQFFV
jgi:hypothetical protein